MPAILSQCGVNIKFKMCSVFLCRFARTLETLRQFIWWNSTVRWGQQLESPIPVFLIQCCLPATAIVSRSIIAFRCNMRTCTTFPICCVSSFQLRTEKTYIHILFLNHFERAKLVDDLFWLKSHDVMNYLITAPYIENRHVFFVVARIT